jgi:hypothetical protein
LSWRLVPHRLAAVLSATLFVTLNADAHLAGEWVVGGVEAKCFAYFFVLFALRELVDSRWNAVWFLFGSACAFHPIVGGWSGLLCGGIWLLSDRQQTPLWSMTPGIVAGAVVALVGILPALTLTLNVPAEVAAESARIYVFERLPHHLALLTLPRDEIELRFSLHALLIAALWLLMRGSKTFVPPTAPLRPIGQFAWGAVILAIAGLTIEIVLWNHHLAAAQLLRYYWFRLTDFAVPMAVALYVVAIITSGLSRRRAWATPALTILIVLLAWQLSSTARMRALSPIPPADARVHDYAAWLDICDWVAANTPVDAVFLTPRSSQSFKWRTGRAEVATRKDIPQDATSMVQWWERLQNIFRRHTDGVTKWVNSPGELGTDRVRELADEYGFDYILSDRQQLLSLPIAYMNDEYVVYQIKN